MNPSLLTNMACVALGGALGSTLRYLASRAINEHVGGDFPWSTLAVNVAGCAIIGLIYGLIERGLHTDEALRLFLTVGFCGGFTTFSTFAHENFLLFGAGRLATVALYAAASFLLGLLALYATHRLATA